MRLILPVGVLLSYATVGAEGEEEFPEVTGCLGPYPGYTGELKIQGNVKLNGDGSLVQLSWFLSGLEEQATGGIHIHTGTSCDNADEVGGHYWDAATEPEDPWNAALWDSSSPGHGFAVQTFEIDGGKAFGYNENVGRAVVVHDASGNRVACAVLNDCPVTAGTTNICLDVMPDYTGGLEVLGEAALEGDMQANDVSYILRGLPASSTGNVKLYGGTCEEVGDMIGVSMTWTTPAQADLDAVGGVITGLHSFPNGELGNYGELVGNVLIVEDADGNSVACGGLDDCAKGSGEGQGSASGLGEGEPVTCKMMSPDENDGDDFCEDLTNDRYGYNSKTDDIICHNNVDSGYFKKGKNCQPLCCCRKTWRKLKGKKCKDWSLDKLQNLPVCEWSDPIGHRCNPNGKRPPKGPRVWDVNNCSAEDEVFDVFEVKCRK